MSTMKLVSIKSGTREVIWSRIYSFANWLALKFAKRHTDNGYPQLATLSFDHIGLTINIEGLYERDDLELVVKWLNENQYFKGVAVDVGANIGNHSIFFSKYYKHVYAFEPNPLTFKILDINCNFCANNVTPFQFGVSDKRGALPFELPNNNNFGGARIVRYKKEEHKTIEIDVVSLDTFVPIINENIGLIKVDVEGYELEVLNGAAELLRKNKPIILFEQHSTDFTNGKSEVTKLLESIGYRFLVTQYMPNRSPHLTLMPRVFNIIRSVIFGSRYELKECELFESRDYHMIIAYNPN